MAGPPALQSWRLRQGTFSPQLLQTKIMAHLSRAFDVCQSLSLCLSPFPSLAPSLSFSLSGPYTLSVNQGSALALTT